VGAILPPPAGALAVRAVAIACAALAFGGCAPLSAAPPTSSATRAAAPGSQAAKLATAERTHEYPGPPVHQTAAAFASPVAAVQTFATAYINWTAATISSRMRALAKLCVGQARSAVSLDAAQTAQDYELRRGGVANSGTVEAVAPVRGAPHEYAVVTRERTTASNTAAYAGLRPAWHVALATVARVSGGGWAVSSWQPEN
jgi:hypothetical protein